jgi:hypothetical protein
MNDDTAAFQAALDAASAMGGGTVVVPAGKFLMKGSIIMANRLLPICAAKNLLSNNQKSSRQSSIFCSLITATPHALPVQRFSVLSQRFLLIMAVGPVPLMALDPLCCPLAVTEVTPRLPSSLLEQIAPSGAF